MKAIVMVDAQWGIGKDGDQLLYIPADLKRFQALTTGHSIVVGRKTLGTFPGGRPLKNRRNLILSTREGFAPANGEVFTNLESLLSACPEDAFVVGGDSVYSQLLPYCDTVYVTKVSKHYEADCFFPALDEGDFHITEEEGPFDHEGIAYSYLTYKRSQKT